ncbi:LysR family transcriptional regulator [Teichococcus oryzae]|uniref:LysR family transcriptional regulator n=1 Tax=Teichococcus oryzae TaxID=1608942 RepID=A0A5B2TJZ5_9PROT|nr:LysR family transcriptional regulator [Pseudoroseomonas oryzae]KAA2214238.1 LysR family transcriptional regulator [Pseudoroseomonas oryzae]
MHFDLTDLRLFLAVAEAGSITAGAARCHLALAAASARLRALEAECGAALLLRGRRGIRLTAPGLEMLHHARLVLGQVAALQAALGGAGGALRATLRLPANGAACGLFLPDALAGFLAAHPGIDVETEEKPSPAVLRMVAGGSAELGIAAHWALDAAPGLAVLPFRTDRLVLVLPRGHALAASRPVAFAELLDQPWIGLDAASALQAHLAWQAARLGGRPRLRARAAGFDAACRMVAAGAGIAILPEAAARPHRRALSIRRLAEAWAVRQLCLCHRVDPPLSEPARLLRDHLRE